MRSQFDFYDFVAYLIPGLLTFGLLCWVLIFYLGMGIDLNGYDAGTATALVFFLFAISYALGHIVQGIGSDLEKKFRIRNFRMTEANRLSEKLLAEMNQDQILRNLKEVLHLPIAVDADKISENRVKELRRLCHSLIAQEGIGRRVDILGGLYRFHRGLLVAVLLAFTIDLFEVSRHAASQFGFTWIENKSYFCGELSHLILSLVLVVALLLTASRVRRRMSRFFDHFEATAFREFFVWRQRLFVHKEMSEINPASQTMELAADRLNSAAQAPDLVFERRRRINPKTDPGLQKTPASVANLAQRECHSRSLRSWRPISPTDPPTRNRR